MSIFKYGFIIWGFFICYTAIFLLYFCWMNWKNRQDNTSA